MRLYRSILLMLVAVLLNGCVSTLYAVPPGDTDEATYAALFPYYVEFCAASEIRKLPGSGVDIGSGGPGGHTLVYMNGVCRKPDEGYPTVALCDGTPTEGEGVGISVNAHYANANWTATPGRDFFFHGDLAPGEALTRAGYERTQAKARALGIFDGVTFQPAAMAGRPADMSQLDYKYELSAATDYAVDFGRDRYCVRVPIDRARMAGVVDYLNAVNAPYRAGVKTFEWDVLRDNCAHLTHNALATVGLWRTWSLNQPLVVAAFDFPVPKNEFVNLVRRTNDLPVDDPRALYGDPALRDALFDQDWLATRPGALVESERAIPVNAMYDTHLRLIFFDEFFTGPYQPWFEQIFHEPRYTDLRANLDHFSVLYSKILAKRGRVPLADAGLAAFEQAYFDHIAAESASLGAIRANLHRITG